MTDFGRVKGVTCTAVAVHAVEAFSAGHASLDRVVYACHEHGEAARLEWIGDLLGYYRYLPRGVESIAHHKCGDLVDFTAPTPPIQPKAQDVEAETQDVVPEPHVVCTHPVDEPCFGKPVRPLAPYPPTFIGCDNCGTPDLCAPARRCSGRSRPVGADVPVSFAELPAEGQDSDGWIEEVDDA